MGEDHRVVFREEQDVPELGHELGTPETREIPGVIRARRQEGGDVVPAHELANPLCPLLPHPGHVDPFLPIGNRRPERQL
jgi:hypothetical protein